MKKPTWKRTMLIAFSIFIVLSITACGNDVIPNDAEQTDNISLTEITAVEGISFSVPEDDLTYAAQQMVQDVTGESMLDLSKGIEESQKNAMVVSSPIWYYQTDESNFYYAAKKISNGMSIGYLNDSTVYAEDIKTALGFETCTVTALQPVENEGLTALIGNITFEVSDLKQNGFITYNGEVCLLQYQDKQYVIVYGMGDEYYSSELLTRLINTIRYTGNSSSLFTPLASNTPVLVCNNTLQIDTCPIIQYSGDDTFKCITDDIAIGCVDSPTGNNMSQAEIVSFMQAFGETMDKFIVTDKDGHEWVCKMIYSQDNSGDNNGITYYAATSFNKKLYIMNTSISSMDSIPVLKESMIALISSVAAQQQQESITTTEASTETPTEASTETTTEAPSQQPQQSNPAPSTEGGKVELEWE